MGGITANIPTGKYQESIRTGSPKIKVAFSVYIAFSILLIVLVVKIKSGSKAHYGGFKGFLDEVMVRGLSLEKISYTGCMK